jgi:hypothetical protein
MVFHSPDPSPNKKQKPDVKNALSTLPSLGKTTLQDDKFPYHPSPGISREKGRG